MAEISPEAAKKLATEMNEHYPAMVYAMTKRSGIIPGGFKISSCKVVAVDSKQCELSYVACKGDACSMPKKAIYKFYPPLNGSSVKMLQLQSRICAPKITWLFTKPLALLILVTCTLLSTLAMGLGVDGIMELLQTMPRLESKLTMVFGSAENVGLVVVFFWIITVVAHLIECCIAYRYCETTLRFSNQVASFWGILVFIVGWPVFEELKELVEWKQLHGKKK